MEMEFVTEISARVDRPQELGDTPAGRRRLIPILGGRASGPMLNGRILPGGADWQTIRADGVAELDARYAIETDDGALIHVRNRGLRSGPPDAMAALIRGEPVDPELIYCRTHPVFDTGAADYAWLNRTMFAGDAKRTPDAVMIRVYRLT